MYGILTAKLSSAPADASYDWQAHAILLPWVSALLRGEDLSFSLCLIVVFVVVIIFINSKNQRITDYNGRCMVVFKAIFVLQSCFGVEASPLAEIMFPGSGRKLSMCAFCRLSSPDKEDRVEFRSPLDVLLRQGASTLQSFNALPAAMLLSSPAPDAPFPKVHLPCAGLVPARPALPHYSLCRDVDQVALTCFFRNSTTFAYAALVAAFTAVVMFTGTSTVLGADGQAVSLARIVNTVVAISIYLTVDTLLG